MEEDVIKSGTCFLEFPGILSEQLACKSNIDQDGQCKFSLLGQVHKNNSNSCGNPNKDILFSQSKLCINEEQVPKCAAHHVEPSHEAAPVITLKDKLPCEMKLNAMVSNNFEHDGTLEENICHSTPKLNPKSTSAWKYEIESTVDWDVKLLPCDDQRSPPDGGECSQTGKYSSGFSSLDDNDTSAENAALCIKADAETIAVKLLSNKASSSSGSDLMDKISIIDIEGIELDSMLMLHSPTEENNAGISSMCSQSKNLAKNEAETTNGSDYYNSSKMNNGACNGKSIRASMTGQPSKIPKLLVNANVRHSSLSAKKKQTVSNHKGGVKNNLVKSKSLSSFNLASISSLKVATSSTSLVQAEDDLSISEMAFKRSKTKKLEKNSSSNSSSLSRSTSLNSLASSSKNNYSHVKSKVRKYIEDIKKSNSCQSSPSRSQTCSPGNNATTGNSNTVYLLNDDLIDALDCSLPDDLQGMVNRLEAASGSPMLLRNLLKQLVEERKSVSALKQMVATLQLDYDNLLAKHSQSQNLIDSLRLQVSTSENNLSLFNKINLSNAFPRQQYTSIFAGHNSLSNTMDTGLSLSQPNLIDYTSYPLIEPSVGLSLDEAGAVCLLPAPFECNQSIPLLPSTIENVKGELKECDNAPILDKCNEATSKSSLLKSRENTETQDFDGSRDSAMRQAASNLDMSKNSQNFNANPEISHPHSDGCANTARLIKLQTQFRDLAALLACKALSPKETDIVWKSLGTSLAELCSSAGKCGASLAMSSEQLRELCAAARLIASKFSLPCPACVATVLQPPYLKRTPESAASHGNLSNAKTVPLKSGDESNLSSMSCELEGWRSKKSVESNVGSPFSSNITPHLIPSSDSSQLPMLPDAESLPGLSDGPEPCNLGSEELQKYITELKVTDVSTVKASMEHQQLSTLISKPLHNLEDLASYSPSKENTSLPHTANKSVDVSDKNFNSEEESANYTAAGRSLKSYGHHRHRELHEPSLHFEATSNAANSFMENYSMHHQNTENSEVYNSDTTCQNTVANRPEILKNFETHFKGLEGMNSDSNSPNTQHFFLEAHSKGINPHPYCVDNNSVEGKLSDCLDTENASLQPETSNKATQRSGLSGLSGGTLGEEVSKLLQLPCMTDGTHELVSSASNMTAAKFTQSSQHCLQPSEGHESPSGSRQEIHFQNTGLQNNFRECGRSPVDGSIVVRNDAHKNCLVTDRTHNLDSLTNITRLPATPYKSADHCASYSSRLNFDSRFTSNYGKSSLLPKSYEVFPVPASNSLTKNLSTSESDCSDVGGKSKKSMGLLLKTLQKDLESLKKSIDSKNSIHRGQVSDISGRRKNRGRTPLKVLHDDLISSGTEADTEDLQSPEKLRIESQFSQQSYDDLNDRLSPRLLRKFPSCSQLTLVDLDSPIQYCRRRKRRSQSLQRSSQLQPDMLCEAQYMTSPKRYKFGTNKLKRNGPLKLNRELFPKLIDERSTNYDHAQNEASLSQDIHDALAHSEVNQPKSYAMRLPRPLSLSTLESRSCTHRSRSYERNRSNAHQITQLDACDQTSQRSESGLLFHQVSSSPRTCRSGANPSSRKSFETEPLRLQSAPVALPRCTCRKENHEAYWNNKWMRGTSLSCPDISHCQMTCPICRMALKSTQLSVDAATTTANSIHLRSRALLRYLRRATKD
ncbi:uncharacterized protein LOC108682661 [Hyalella azteca]|uniref:Uncharacterized protein LOC108682661 n=1 Tax=Hyalella azteca TaxID=294128 RepID=A0A8B7PMF7_HYAAZ|nr:uncharacterized protein LOC108682661 [Hyalella azteca]